MPIGNQHKAIKLTLRIEHTHTHTYKLPHTHTHKHTPISYHTHTPISYHTQYYQHHKTLHKMFSLQKCYLPPFYLEVCQVLLAHTTHVNIWRRHRTHTHAGLRLR